MKKLILVFLIAPLLSQAQSIPGYLGRKQIISYDFSFFPSITTTNNEDLAEGIVRKFTSKSGITYDYIYDKQTALTASFDYTYTFIEAVTGIPDGFTFARNPKINSFGFSIGAKTYLQHLAPLGSQIELKLLYRNSYISDFGTDDEIPTSVEGSKVSQFGFGIGYLKSRVIKDHFVFSYGMNVNFLLSPSDILFIDTAPVFFFNETLKENIKTRIQLKEAFYMKLSIGYLI